MYGRWRSSGALPPERSRSSATEPMHSSSPQLGVAAAPDRQRRAPVAVAGQRPVDVVLEPLAETAVLDVLGVPADCLVVGEHLLLHLGGADVPAGSRVVEERRAAAPAVWVGMLVDLLAEEQAAALEVGDQRPGHLRVLDEAVLEAGDAIVVVTVRLNRVVESLALGRVKDLVLGGNPVVVLAKSGGDVDEAGPVLGGDEVTGDHRVAAGLAIAELEDRAPVVAADQLGAGEAVGHRHPLAQHRLEQRLGHDQGLAGDPGADVGDLGRERDGDVAGQGPRGRRPDQQRLVALPPVLGQERELDVDRGVLDVLIALRHLVRGERGAVAGAVWDDLVTLV